VNLNLTATEFLLENLSPTTLYGNFTIFAENSIGRSEESSSDFVETLLEGIN